MRSTKIICTLGPAVDTEEAMEKLILGGMNAARFNFSHGTHESQLASYERLCRVRTRLRQNVATILDTKGPEIRICDFAQGKVSLCEGATFTLTTRSIPGDERAVSVSYHALPAELSTGDRVLIDDGLVELRVEECSETDVRCTVINGGVLSNRKSINLPGVSISLPAITEKDAQDLAFAAQHGFDWIAASFIRSKKDVEELRQVLREHGGEGIRIMAKIENREGVDKLDEILDVVDGVMVARGDLGVEIPAEQVPVVQKNMVRAARKKGKIVVIATQMLDSMIRNPRPTRAEVSDVANAIFEGADCVMLSGETASGAYPFAALATMVETIRCAEESMDGWARFRATHVDAHPSIDDAIAHACCTTAMDLSAAAIVAMTRSGHTARIIARFRPGCPILALTPSEQVCRQLAICRGVVPLRSKEAETTDELIALTISAALEYAEPGSHAVITAGIPLGRASHTNLIHAVKI